MEVISFCLTLNISDNYRNRTKKNAMSNGPPPSIDMIVEEKKKEKETKKEIQKKRKTEKKKKHISAGNKAKRDNCVCVACMGMCVWPR